MKYAFQTPQNKKTFPNRADTAILKTVRVRLRPTLAPFGYVNIFVSQVNTGFFHRTALPDPARLLQGTGKFMRQVKVRSRTDTNATALSRLVEAAYSHIKPRVENCKLKATRCEADADVNRQISDDVFIGSLQCDVNWFLCWNCHISGVAYIAFFSQWNLSALKGNLRAAPVRHPLGTTHTRSPQ